MERLLEDILDLSLIESGELELKITPCPIAALVGDQQASLVTAQIGVGGMGEVYRARDTRLNRDVAIKVLPAAFADDPERLARFTREAQTLASLNHPNIVAIKEATGSLQQGSEVMALCGDKIDVLSGDDFITFPMMACGAKGIISVLANIMPKAVGDLTDAFFAGDLAKARQLLGFEAEVVADMAANRVNSAFLPGVTLDNAIDVTTDRKSVV